MAVGEYSSLVPRDLDANLAFRKKVSKKGYESRAQAEALRGMCKQDILFFINTFCWMPNPMWHPNCPERPFLTYPFQEYAIQRMLSSLARAGKPTHLGKTDLVFLKSRGTGGSCVPLLLILWRSMFFRGQSFLLVSRKESLVDTPKNLDTLMPKLDYVLERLPRWLRPKMQPNDRVELKFHFPHTGSVINGTATTGDFSRGGRPTAIMSDEFGFFEMSDSFKALKAATGASFCCWFISTTNGVGNAFHKIVTDAQMERLDFRWEDMPAKRAGLYRSVNGKLDLLDPGYVYPPGHEFINDGDLRSVWYDAEERRTQMRSLMAQEHKREFVGSGDPFFDAKELEPLMAKTRPPTEVKTLQSDNGSKSELRLWLAPRTSKAPPLDRCYVLGVDVCAGTGASNACITVFDCRLREKVGELADPKLDPTELAEIAAQIGRWFEDWTGAPALLAWEANGPVGISFGKRILELEYENSYYSVTDLTGDERKARAPGIWVTGKSAQTLIRDYGVALCRGTFKEPSEEGLKECYDYRYFPGGRVAHYKAMGSDEASGARENHGDRVAANAVALRAASSISEPVPTGSSPVEPSYPCFYTEMQEHRKARRQERRVAEGWLTG